MRRIVVIEDEPISAARLSRMIAEIIPDSEIEPPLTSVSQVKERLRSATPYWLIFADIRIGGGDVFEALKDAAPSSFVIFTTAYDDYALKAIKSNGVDYLLKPIDRNELEAAIGKVTKLSEAAESEAAPKGMAGWRKRLMANDDGLLIPVEVESINYMTVDGKQTIAHLRNGDALLLDQPMNEVETRLDPDVFFRLNRQYIVNIRAIKSVKCHFSSRLIIAIEGCDDGNVTVSRQRAMEFRRWIDR